MSIVAREDGIARNQVYRKGDLYIKIYSISGPNLLNYIKISPTPIDLCDRSIHHITPQELLAEWERVEQ